MPDGYPHVTPIWFVWAACVFHLTSYPRRPPPDRIGDNPRVGLVIDVEDEQRAEANDPTANCVSSATPR